MIGLPLDRFACYPINIVRAPNHNAHYYTWLSAHRFSAFVYRDGVGWVTVVANSYDDLH